MSDPDKTTDETAVFAGALEFLDEEKNWIALQIKRHLGRLPTKQRLILDLGSHAGHLLKKILYHSSPHLLPGSRIVCVEEDGLAISRFESFDQYANLSIETKRHNLEAFLTSATSVYDLIIASHSLYWVKDLQATLNQCLQLGRNVAIVIRGQEGTWQLQKSLISIIGNPESTFYSNIDIERLLQKASIPYHKETKTIEIPIPCDKENLDKIAGFLLQLPPDKLTQSKVSTLHAYLSGKKSLPEPNHFYWIARGEDD